MTIHTTINSSLPPATAFQTVVAKHTASATVDRDSLAKAVAACNRVVMKRNAIPILGNVLLRGTASGLVVTGTDCDRARAISCPVSGEVDAGFTATVPGHMLASLLKSAKSSDTAKIEVYGETLVTETGNQERPGTACLDFAGFKATLPTLPVADFPTLESGEFTNYFTLPTADLLRALQKTHFAVSTEETRYYLCGVYMHAVGKDLRFAATDGHRLAVVTVPAPTFLDIGGLPLKDVAGYIIRSQTVAELIRLCKAKGAPKEVRFAASDRVLRITVGDVEVLTRHIDGMFPDYWRVVPSGADKRLTIDRQEMLAAIAQVTCLSKNKLGAPIKLSIGDDSRLRLSAKDPDSGAVNADIESTWDHGPMEIGFNAKYLTSILDMVDGFSAEIMLDSPGSPVIIRSNDSADHYYVLMPMRC